MRPVGVADHQPNDPHIHFDDFSSQYPSGVHMLFGDGSVHKLRDNIDIRIYQGLSTRQGGEAVPTP